MKPLLRTSALSTALAATLIALPSAHAQAPAADDDLEVPASNDAAPVAPAPSAAAPSSAPAPIAQPAPTTAPPAAPVAPAAAAPAVAKPGASPAPQSPEKTGTTEKATASVSATAAATPVAADVEKPAADKDTTGPSAPLREPLTRSVYTRLVPLGFEIGGYIQAQYEHNQISEDQLTPDGQPINQDQYVLRRARLRLDHGWDYAAATLELDANTVNGLRIGVRRAEATLLYRGDSGVSNAPLLALTGGITDIPFGAELGASPRDRAFMERSLGSRALFPTEADLGAKVWGAYKFINYAVAYVNGEPQNGSGLPRDPNGDKDLVGRVGVDAQPSDDFQANGGVSFYKGQGFHAGQAATKGTLTWVDIDNNSLVDDGEVFGVTPTAAQPSKNFERWALGLDLGLYFKTSFGLSSLEAEAFAAKNLDRGVLRADPVTSGVDARETGFSVGFTQELTEYGVVGIRASYYDPNSDLFEQRVGEFQPKKANFVVLSPVVGVRVPHGKLLVEYDLVQDYLARDKQGVPTDAENDQLTVRVQVDL